MAAQFQTIRFSDGRMIKVCVWIRNAELYKSGWYLFKVEDKRFTLKGEDWHQNIDWLENGCYIGWISFSNMDPMITVSDKDVRKIGA